MRLRSLLVSVVVLLVAPLAHATSFNVTLASGDGQFPGKEPAAFGNVILPTDVNLTPDQSQSILVNQFTNFFPLDTFPHEPGASTSFTQTLTVNGVSTSVVRTVTLQPTGDGCTLVQQLSPVVLTVDLGTAGKVTLDLRMSPTLAVPCSNGQPTNPLVVIPGTFRSITATILDDFVLYKVKTSKGAPKFASLGPVTLADALGGGDYDVLGIAALGVPASLNGAGTFDAATHLAAHRLKRRKTSGKFAPVPDVPVANACGDLVVTAVKPESLLVPVNASVVAPPPLVDPGTSLVDHFLCYKAKVQTERTDGTRAAVLPKQLQLDAADAFQSRRYDVKKVTRLCVPVDKSGAPVELQSGAPVALTPAVVRHALSQLVCYQVKPAKSTIAQTACGPVTAKDKGTKIVPKQPKHEKRLGVLIAGQLGGATLDTAKEQEVCVPILSGLSD